MQKTKHYKINVIFGLSNINADFLQLILCMFVSHSMLNNPFYGAALFLFTNIWTLYFEGNLRAIEWRKRKSLRGIMWALLTASVIAGLILVFLYPAMRDDLKANYVSFFVLILTARSILTFVINRSYHKTRNSHRVLKIIFQLIFLIPCIIFAVMFMEGVVRCFVITGSAITGFLMSFQSSTLVSFGKYLSNNRQDKIGRIFSYQMFSNMSLYSQVAFSLGALMYICYISFMTDTFSANTYLIITVWLLGVLLFEEAFTWFAHKRGWIASINMFIAGVILWTIGSAGMHRVTDLYSGWFWTIFWALGLAFVTAVTNRYNTDLKMVAELAGRRVSNRDMHFRNMLTQIIAVIVSNGIMLCILTLWTFIIPTMDNTHLPDSFRNVMIQLPMLFMLISLIFAFRQPLDDRFRQKLVNYRQGINKNPPTKQNLDSHLVKKNKVHFGVRIIASVMRLTMRLRVSGHENINSHDFPAIFVCNHGIIWGPIAAVVYLPTYFRPWVDVKMSYPELCAKEIYLRSLRRAKFMPEKMKQGISKLLSKPVTWALNSYSPIDVKKNSQSNLDQLFEDTVQALQEGDNVLIFPERPKRIKKDGYTALLQETTTLGEMYSGFASIGNIYFERTGKTLRFYPVYANRQAKTFRIGKPIEFNPHNDPEQERDRITAELREKMLELK